MEVAIGTPTVFCADSPSEVPSGTNGAYDTYTRSVKDAVDVNMISSTLTIPES